jgi:hypothetical protein
LLNSLAQQLYIPARPVAPASQSTTSADIYYDDGQIIGVNDSMDYRHEDSEQWISVRRTEDVLELLAPGIYYVRYRAIAATSFSSYITTLVVGQSVSPTIVREIFLPEAPAGITVLPRVGAHYTPSNTNFVFSLLFEGSTPPTVKTNRVIDGKQEVLTGRPNGTGGYDYVITNVRETVRVEISSSSANEVIRGSSSWAYGGNIFIEAQQRETVDVYTVSGVLLKRLTVSEGLTSIPVAQGIYVVLLNGGIRQKVVVR